MDSVIKYFAAFMCLAYVLLGAAMIWGSKEVFNVPNKYSLPMGSILMAYGVFRGYRIYQKYFAKS
ncbi:MAG TPA: hypothetical protein VKQ08_03435 [Cyclobacteriaceae bacterium]|nr:hypothetical protein [Cyclobacteriaceae bacterium]